MTQRIIRLAALCFFICAADTLTAQNLAIPGQAVKNANPTNAAPASSTNEDKIVTNAPPSAPIIRQSVRTVPHAWVRDTNDATFKLPPSVPDPLEKVNRVVWSFNKGVLIGVLQPSGKVYRVIVFKPVRTGIANIGQNMLYPGRLLNNLLQGKFIGARNETDRFLCNSILGVGGFFDFATRWKIPASQTDFGQTFGQWGWKPDFFLMLPIFGPSNDRDTVGLIGDTLDNPLTYFSPYSYITYGIDYNDLTGSVDDYVRFIHSEMDPYAELQYAWTFVRENKVADFKEKGKQDAPSLETLQSVFFTFKDPKFPNKGRTRSVLIAATGKKLKFTYWLQPGKAPVVYIIPGLGSHRLAESAIALAELAYNRGFSAVTVSSVYNSEFMENASTANLPAYTPIDSHDLHVALTDIDHKLEELYPGRLKARALLGYSMGAFQSLFIAADAATNSEPLLKFDRYVAINTPVRLLYGISKLDEYYRAPNAWPPEDCTSNIENTFLKVAALGSGSLRPEGALPFNAIESKFLIGFTFRLILRDIIYSSQLRHNQGVLTHPIHPLRRDALYKEIMQFSYKDYIEAFVIPYYQSRGIDLNDPHVLEKASDLRLYTSALKANPNVRLVGNRDDFLLADEDYEWLRTTFPTNRLTMFEKGGHLGNLAHPAVQKAIFNALEDLVPEKSSAK